MVAARTAERDYKNKFDKLCYVTGELVSKNVSKGVSRIVMDVVLYGGAHSNQTWIEMIIREDLGCAQTLRLPARIVRWGICV